MPGLGLIALFAAATFVLTVTPGTGVLYVVGRSVGGGRAVGLASMLGIETGEAVYIAAAALGITAVLATSATAHSVVRYAGAAYLLFLGIRAWRHPDSDEQADARAGTGPLTGADCSCSCSTPRSPCSSSPTSRSSSGRGTRSRRRRARISAVTYFVLAAAAIVIRDRGDAAKTLQPAR